MDIQTDPRIAAYEMNFAERRFAVRRSSVLTDYWTLMKPEINCLIAVTVGAGFYAGYLPKHGGFPLMLLFQTLVGTLLVAGGAAALNQYAERHLDGRMARTAARPLPSGRVDPPVVLWFGSLLSFAGVIYLAMTTNALASMFAALTLALYLAVYTPLKRKTPLCTLAGAVPGAMPVLIGWAAASGSLSAKAGVLYGVLFLWQVPHFMAIAWMYRQDYSRAGYLVLPRGDLGGRVMSWQAVLASLSLIVLTLNSGPGTYYLLAAFILSSVYFYYSVCLASVRSNLAARRLLAASIVYLPLALFLIVLDKV